MKKTNAGIGDYLASDYVSHAKLLPEAQYSQALDTLVIACVDIVPTFEKKILLAKRTRHPQFDWWIFGGRMHTGEHLNSAAKRLVKTEMGLDIKADRFCYLLSFAAAWGKRAHNPEENGTHTLSATFYVELTPQEVTSFILNDEYSDAKLISLEELLKGNKIYHPALHQCALALKATHR